MTEELKTRHSILTAAQCVRAVDRHILSSYLSTTSTAAVQNIEGNPVDVGSPVAAEACEHTCGSNATVAARASGFLAGTTIVRLASLAIFLIVLTSNLSAFDKGVTAAVPFQDPARNVLANGYLIFQLNRSAMVIGGGEVVQNIPVKIPLTSGGLISPSFSIWFNDELQPTGTSYIVKVYNSNNLLVRGLEKWTLAGASPLDVSQIANANLLDPGLGQPVLQNPSSVRTITRQNLGLSSSGPLTVPGTATFSGTTTAKNPNNIQFADQQTGETADVQIVNAISNLPRGGGIVDARGYGCTTQRIANQLLIGSASKQVTLIVDRCTVFQVSVTGGVDAIQVYNDSSIKAVEGSNPLNANAGFALTSSANIASLLSCQPTSAQNTCNLENITLKGNPRATVSSAMLLLTGITDIATFRNLLIWDFYNTVGLKILATTNVPVGPVNFENLSVNGLGNSGARPVQIYETSKCTNCGISGVNFFGGTLVHPGSGGLPIVDINGQGVSGALSGVNFFGTYFEPINGADIGIKIRDAANIVLAGVTSAGVSAADLVNLSQSGAGLTHAVRLLGVRHNGNWTNTVNDTINNRTYTKATIPDLTFGDISYITNLSFPEGSTPPAATGMDVCYGDSSAHALKCSYNNGSFFNQTLTVGSGTSTTNGTAINPLTCQTQPTITVTGATTTDTATCSLNTALPPSWQTGIVLSTPSVISNTVTYSLCNPTATASITPTATAVRCTVIR